MAFWKKVGSFPRRFLGKKSQGINNSTRTMESHCSPLGNSVNVRAKGSRERRTPLFSHLQVFPLSFLTAQKIHLDLEVSSTSHSYLHLETQALSGAKQAQTS